MRIEMRVTRVTLLMLVAAGLAATQSAPNCAYREGDSTTGTYCLSCDGMNCTKCHNGFADWTGKCALHNIPNCYMAERMADGRVICRMCQKGYHVTPYYPDSTPNACSPNPLPGSPQYRDSCAFYAWRPPAVRLLEH